uniref:Uncharacterized protein n=1 Tax=Pseudochorda nagaii TaxID=74379 RepID=A0A8F0FDH0_9PHAE|nr:hypothetical protein [Pseudochorda nagaii]
MTTPRKRHLRKKRFFLPIQQTFALFNASNLKASKIAKIRLSLTNGKLYSVPLYLTPPKLGAGCPIIMIIYDRLEDLQTNIPEIALQVDCLGVSINKRWYPSSFFEGDKTTNLYKKTFSLLLAQHKTLKE